MNSRLDMNYVLNARKAPVTVSGARETQRNKTYTVPSATFSLKEWKHYITEKNYIIVKTSMEEKNWCYGSIQYKGLPESGWRGEAGKCQEGKGGGPSRQTQYPAVTLSRRQLPEGFGSVSVPTTYTA